MMSAAWPSQATTVEVEVEEVEVPRVEEWEEEKAARVSAMEVT